IVEIVISSVTNQEEELAVLKIRKQVFEQEMGIAVDPLRGGSQKHALHLLARSEPESEVVAALSVVETTDNYQLHERYGLNFASHVRVARYTQLAVAKPYRGLGIPLILTLEANRRFVAPEQFQYTWLLYKAERAAASSFCQLLEFTPGDRCFQSEYGHSRMLLRNEFTHRSIQAVCRAEQYLQDLLKSSSISVRSKPETGEPVQHSLSLPDLATHG